MAYAGPKGKNVIKSMNNNVQRILPNNVKTRITYTDRKLGTKFQLKDRIKNQHEHDLIYFSKCLEPNCDKDYLGETRRRIIERAADHCGKDKQSHLLKHALISNHPVVDLKDLKVIDKNYHGNKYKRKISEALYIKQYRPLLSNIIRIFNSYLNFLFQCNIDNFFLKVVSGNCRPKYQF